LESLKESYITSVYRVIDHIERHYDEPLSLESLAVIAGFSKYHFHRIFKSIVGETVAEYIRRVRMQSTPLKLKTRAPITQIALDSGYETNASFSKAFKKHFGMTPKAFAQRVRRKKGARMLTPHYVTIDPVNVLYVRKTGNYYESTASAWNVLVSYAEKHQLFGKVADRYGIAYDNPDNTEENQLRYDACFSLKDNVPLQPEGEVCEKRIEGGAYARFLHKGSYETLDKTYTQIGDWMVESGVKLRNQPVFQKYLDLDPRGVKPDALQTEIYVPIE